VPGCNLHVGTPSTLISENFAVEGFDLFEAYIARVAGSADVGDGLFGKTGYVGLGDTEVGHVLGYAYFEGEGFNGFAGGK